MSRFVRKAVVAALAVVAASVAEAKWTCSWIDGWFVVFTDGTWTIRCSRGTVTDADGTTYASPHIFSQITKAPEGGGDLDMSTLWEDVLEQKPTYTFDGQAPVGMYGNFYVEIKNKKVTSIKFPSCLRVVNGWSTSTLTYNGCTTNIVFNQGLNTINEGFVSFMTNLVTVSGIETVRHIEKDSFKGCVRLQSVDPYLPTSVVTVASTAFSGCAKLTGDLVYRSTEHKNVLTLCGYPKTVTFNDAITNLNVGFAYKGLTSVGPFPADLTSINGCFTDWSSPKAGDSKMPLTADFSACTNLTDLPCLAGGSVQLRSVILPPRIKSIANGAFQGCANLTNVLYAADRRFRNEMMAASGTVGYNAFLNCTKLDRVEFPWGGTETTIGNQCFAGAYQLRHLKFNGRPPETMAASAFDYVDGTDGVAAYALRIYASPRQDRAAWLAFRSREVTDADRQRARYPGSKTFGVYTYDYSNPAGSTRSQWLVWEKGCWDLPQGMVIIVR